jgi:hypothetical protein
MNLSVEQHSHAIGRLILYMHLSNAQTHVEHLNIKGSFTWLHKKLTIVMMLGCLKSQLSDNALLRVKKEGRNS